MCLITPRRIAVPKWPLLYSVDTRKPSEVSLQEEDFCPLPPRKTLGYAMEASHIFTTHFVSVDVRTFIPGFSADKGDKIQWKMPLLDQLPHRTVCPSALPSLFPKVTPLPVTLTLLWAARGHPASNAVPSTKWL